MDNNMDEFQKEAVLDPIPSPVEIISGVWKFIRPQGFQYSTHSLPDHLIQLVTTGSYSVRINEREYKIQKGGVVYFYASEKVDWINNDERVEFYSVGFTSLTFSPIAIEHRIFYSSKKIRDSFDQLHQAFQMPHHLESRSYLVYAALMEILFEIKKQQDTSMQNPKHVKFWYNTEIDIRKNHLFKLNLGELAERYSCSKSFLVRACKNATGTTPTKRIQELRMEEAKNLLHFSTKNVTEVSEYLGYTRVHEFSREFTSYFGVSPKHMFKENK